MAFLEGLMRNYTIPMAMLLSVCASNVSADALGLYVGGGLWDHDPTGTFASDGDTNINVESTLDYKGDSDTYFYAAFEHFVPLVPNIRVEIASMAHDGSANSVIFNGLGVSGNASTSLDTTDAIAYWRLLDNWVNLDFGLNIRQVDANFLVGSESVDVSETIPMLYVAAQFDMPFTGLSFGADINTINYSGVTYQDMRIRALYEFGVVGLEAGLKSTTIELDDVDNINADLEFKGLMIGAFLHF